MSADASIKIGFQKVEPEFKIVRVRPLELVEAFVACGWSLTSNIDPQKIARCWSFEPEREEVAGSVAEVLATIAKWQLDSNVLGLQIWWNGEAVGGLLHIRQREQEVSLGMETRGSWRTLPGRDGFTDDTWFLPKLLAPIERTGAKAYMVNSFFHW